MQLIMTKSAKHKLNILSLQPLRQLVNDNVKLNLIFRYLQVLFNLIFVLKTRLRVMKSILIESLNV